MPQELLDFLKQQRVGVLAVQMPDSSPHGATVHFSHTEDPLIFTFETHRDYRKCEPLFANSETPATFVTGFTEGASKTAQLDGIVQLIDADDERVERYLQKFPEKREKSQGEKVVWFTFTPHWWRFTDWTTPEGKKIWVSE